MYNSISSSTEEVKDESTLVAMIKTALQQGVVEAFRSEMTGRIKKVNKKLRNICKEEYEGYIHVMNQVPLLEENLASISDSLAAGYQKIYVLLAIIFFSKAAFIEPTRIRNMRIQFGKYRNSFTQQNLSKKDF